MQAGRFRRSRAKEGEQPLSLLWVYSQWAGFVLAGWLPLRKPGQLLSREWRPGLWLARTETQATLQHYNVCHCCGQRGKEKDRKRERVTEDWGGNSGSVWFWQEWKERKKECLLWCRKEIERVEEGVEKTRKGGKCKKKKKKRQVSFTVLHCTLIYVYSWFCIIHKISWCNWEPSVGNRPPPLAINPLSDHTVQLGVPTTSGGDSCPVSELPLEAGVIWRIEELEAASSQSEYITKHKTLIQSGSWKSNMKEVKKNQQFGASTQTRI